MISGLVCALLLAAPASAAPARKKSLPSPAKNKEAVTMEWKGQSGGPVEPSAEIVKTKEHWDALWSRIGAPAPSADFEKYFAAAVLLGEKTTGGYKIVFLEPSADRSRTIRYKVSAPGEFAIQMLTRPYAVRLYPRTMLPATIDRAD